MQVKRIPAGVYAANCYVLMDETTKETAILDPGGDAEDIIKEVDKLGGKVKYILFTHGHLDHIGGAEAVKNYFKAPLYIQKKDEEFIQNGEELFTAPTSDGLPIKMDGNIAEGDVLNLGEVKINCIETPGHTLGGMSFLMEDKVFTGDTLFLNSVGRTDFIGGDHATLLHSIKTKLLTLDENVIVYPGHGPQSTIKNEKLHNPFL